MVSTKSLFDIAVCLAGFLFIRRFGCRTRFLLFDISVAALSFHLYYLSITDCGTADVAAISRL